MKENESRVNHANYSWLLSSSWPNLLASLLKAADEALGPREILILHNLFQLRWYGPNIHGLGLFYHEVRLSQAPQLFSECQTVLRVHCRNDRANAGPSLWAVSSEVALLSARKAESLAARFIY